jgi:hypothetical protein
MTDAPKSPDRTIHVKDAAEGGEAEGGEAEADEGLATDEGPAQADAEDPTMGGSSDGDTAP